MLVDQPIHELKQENSEGRSFERRRLPKLDDPCEGLRLLLIKAALAIPVVFVGLLLLPTKTCAQGLELSGGWPHISGNGGTDGFNVGAAWSFTRRLTMAAQYEDTWDTSQLGTFTLTKVGAIVVKNHFQEALAGPRVFFPYKKMEKYKVEPFGEAQFGVSYLKSKVQQPAVGTVSASDTAFSWMLGGGADYRFSPHWLSRVNLDLLRTHLAASGQTHLRFSITFGYIIGSR